MRKQRRSIADTSSRETPKPGIYTTEFLVTVLVILAATVLMALDKIDASVWGLATGLPTTGYAVSRGIAKSG